MKTDADFGMGLFLGAFMAGAMVLVSTQFHAKAFGDGLTQVERQSLKRWESIAPKVDAFDDGLIRCYYHSVGGFSCVRYK